MLPAQHQCKVKNCLLSSITHVGYSIDVNVALSYVCFCLTKAFRVVPCRLVSSCSSLQVCSFKIQHSLLEALIISSQAASSSGMRPDHCSHHWWHAHIHEAMTVHAYCGCAEPVDSTGLSKVAMPSVIHASYSLCMQGMTVIRHPPTHASRAAACSIADALPISV